MNKDGIDQPSEEDPLVLKLAERLYMVSDAYWNRPSTPFRAIASHTVNQYCLMARECLRVAEWAVYVGAARMAAVVSGTRAEFGRPSLTLPPDDWQP